MSPAPESAPRIMAAGATLPRARDSGIRALTPDTAGRPWFTPHRLWLVAGLSVCIAIGIAHVLYYWPEVIDDAYIVFRYARNFVRGDGIAFNPGGARVEGFSTVAWFWLSALSLKLGSRDVLES